MIPGAAPMRTPRIVYLAIAVTGAVLGYVGLYWAVVMIGVAAWIAIGVAGWLLGDHARIDR